MGDINHPATTHHQNRYKQNHTSTTQIIKIYTCIGLGIPPVEDSASRRQGGGVLQQPPGAASSGFETSGRLVSRQ
jgi:hypothetical protein